jgi:hypothetical protein
VSPRALGALLRLFPRGWRERYGEEFAALLEATQPTAAVVLDVARAAVRERLRPGSAALQWVTALACSALCVAQADRLGITRNIFWAPSTPLRGVALAITVTPLALLAARLGTAVHRRRRAARRA